MHETVLTVSLNAAVDVVYDVDGFAAGKINNVRDMQRMAGGKANNVARVLASLGVPVVATGFVGGAAGDFIRADLQRRGITPAFEASGAENRTCTTVIDRIGHTVTELRERGPLLTADQAARFRERFRELVRQAGLVVISGSLPPGIPPDFYATLVTEAWQTGQVRTLLDATGPALRAALPAHPYLVKPNLDELTEWAGTPLTSDHAIWAAARKLQQSGPMVVAVSLGARGMLLVSPEGSWWVTPQAVDAVNTVGSGDSLVAGFAAGLLNGLDAESVMRLAVGCGTANALTRAVADVRPADLERIRSQIQIRRLG